MENSKSGYVRIKEIRSSTIIPPRSHDDKDLEPARTVDMQRPIRRLRQQLQGVTDK